MKTTILSFFVATLLLNISFSNAATSSLIHLGSQFKTDATKIQLKQNEQALAIVYGGADISNKRAATG